MIIKQPSVPSSPYSPAGSTIASIGGIDSFSPDWCSLGVVLRVLLVTNSLAVLALIWPWLGWEAWLHAFVESALWLEPSLFLSLILLCAVRHACLHLGLHTLWLQRFAALTIPPSMMALVYLALGWLLFLNENQPTMIWMRLLWAAALGLFFQHYFELRARAFSPALAEARLQALQARIRPHFLFNSLNAVLGIVRTDPRRAESTLEDLADLFRELMRERNELVPLENEVALCRRYVSVESLRLGERLQVQWRLDNMPKTAVIPSLLLQPLLENAVHHGIEPSSHAGTISVEITTLDTQVRIQIRNPYLALHTSQGNHMALDNIRARLALLYDVEASLEVKIETANDSVQAATHHPASSIHQQHVVTLTFPNRGRKND